MNSLIEILKIALPSGLVLFGMYLTAASFIKKDLVDKELQIRAETTKTLLPIRLQAYERMCLFLERIAPNNLLLRLSGRASNVAEFQQILLTDIRDEFSHNLSQQVYMSDEAWTAVKNSMNEISALINLITRELDPAEAPIELSKKLFEVVISKGISPTDEALRIVKEEFRRNFID
jgi:hypothetical protein